MSAAPRFASANNPSQPFIWERETRLDLTWILRIDISLPWNRAVNEWPRRPLVDEQREVDRDLGAAPATDISRERPAGR